MFDNILSIVKKGKRRRKINLLTGKYRSPKSKGMRRFLMRTLQLIPTWERRYFSFKIMIDDKKIIFEKINLKKLVKTQLSILIFRVEGRYVVVMKPLCKHLYLFCSRIPRQVYKAMVLQDVQKTESTQMCEEEEYSSIQVFAWDVELKSKMKIVSFLFFYVKTSFTQVYICCMK